MKTQIIQLDEHDDTLSVRDKMDWSQTPRVLLVWPPGRKVLRTRLDLVLLERVCSAQGSQLAVATNDPEVLFHAGEAGIPVFRSRKEAQIQPWRKSFREFRRQELEKYAAENALAVDLDRDPPQPRKRLPIWARISIFTLGVLAVISLAAFLLPSAEITVFPQKKQQMLLIPVQAQPGRTQITLSGIVPALEMTILVEEQGSILSTGTTSIPADYAQGEVVFTNLGENEVIIPTNTILSTGDDSPVLFRTLTVATLPPEQGSQIKLDVEAYLPGETGNVPANQITKINLEAGAELTVTNPQPTEGGSDDEIPAPVLVDRLQLANVINDLLVEKARAEVSTRLGLNDLLLTTRLNDFDIVNDLYTPEGDAPGEFLWLERSIEYRVLYVAADDLYQLASDLVKAQYQNDTDQPDLNSIQIQIISPPEKSSGEKYEWNMQVSWLDSQTFNSEEISNLVAATSVEEANEILTKNLDLEEAPLINLQPSWWPRIPALSIRIQVQQGGN